MTATTHALTGASLGSLIPNPFLALFLSLVSNFLLDLLPHWDVGTGWRQRRKFLTFIFAGIDVLVGFSLGFWLFGNQIDLPYLFLLMLTATLADWLEAPYLFLNWNFPPFSWFYQLQSKLHWRDGTFWGIVSQIVIVVPLVFLAKQN